MTEIDPVKMTTFETELGVSTQPYNMVEYQGKEGNTKVISAKVARMMTTPPDDGQRPQTKIN